MIDNKTPNRNYPLPHPDNIARQDVERIATAITMIDADVSEAQENISDATNKVDELKHRALKLPVELVGEVNPEVQDISPSRYLVVNKEGTGFTTVEGGGGEGGAQGEVLIKRSGKNFDTTWTDPRALYKKLHKTKEVDTDASCDTNSTVILCDAIEIDNGDELPRLGLTIKQATEDMMGVAFGSYVFRDDVEETEEAANYATKAKHGIVKVGAGFEVENGVISVPGLPLASSTQAGIVKLGDGISLSSDGVISVEGADVATHETLGTVKLGDEFKVDNNGALRLVESGEEENIIYQSARVVLADNNGVILMNPHCAHYRANITQDCTITFDFSIFAPTEDISFDLTLFANDTYLVQFAVTGIVATVDFEDSFNTVRYGTAYLEFSKNAGMGQILGKFLKMDGNRGRVRLMSAVAARDVTDEVVLSTNGYATCLGQLTTGNVGWKSSSNPADQEVIFYFDFDIPVCVEDFYINSRDKRTTTYLYLEGSIDKIHWKQLALLENVDLEGNHRADTFGYFCYFRVRFIRGNLEFGNFALYGYWSKKAERRKLVSIMPEMSQDSQGGYEIIYSTTPDAGDGDTTLTHVDSGINMPTKDAEGHYWIEYKLPIAEVVNLISVMVRYLEIDMAPKWFKVVGSNDEENWSTLLERRYTTKLNLGETKEYWLPDNTTAYKYYRFVCMDTPGHGRFRLSGFHLYKALSKLGTDWISTNMSGYSGDGCFVTASSEWNQSDWAAWGAFGEGRRGWFSAKNRYDGEWICLRFLDAVALNCVKIRAINDDNYKGTPIEFDIQASIDNVEWVTLKSVTEEMWQKGQERIYEFLNNDEYCYYRILSHATISTGASGTGIGHLSFGRKMINNGEFDFVEEEAPNVTWLIPQMLDYSSSGYTVSASSEWSTGWRSWYAFSDNNYSGWYSAKNGYSESWICIALPEAVVMNCAYLRSINSSSDFKSMPTSFEIQASTDNTTWVTLKSVEDEIWVQNQERIYDFTNEDEYSYYRILIHEVVDAGASQNASGIARLNFGRKVINNGGAQ